MPRYTTFCQLIGQETMRRALFNSSLVEQMMYDRFSDTAASSEILKIPPSIVNMSLAQVQHDDSPELEYTVGTKGSMFGMLNTSCFFFCSR